MKNLKYIMLILFIIGTVTATFAQTCELKLKDILTIDSQQNFERVLIENNFQRENLEEIGWKKEAEELSKNNTLLLAYGFGRASLISEYGTKIMAMGSFPKTDEINTGDNFDLMFAVRSPEDEYGFYNRIFLEVKGKCMFDKITHTEDGMSASFYNCPNTRFEGKIGFSITDGNGFIIIKSAGPLKELDSLMGDFKDDNSKVAGDPNASGYYGTGGSDSGGNYRLGNRKALTMPKPTYDCNEEGKVFVSVFVDNSGNVITAQSGVKGTTNSAACLLQRAKEAALKTKFNSDSNAPSTQVGIIIYNFSLSD